MSLPNVSLFFSITKSNQTKPCIDYSDKSNQSLGFILNSRLSSSHWSLNEKPESTSRWCLLFSFLFFLTYWYRLFFFLSFAYGDFVYLFVDIYIYVTLEESFTLRKRMNEDGCEFHSTDDGTDGYSSSSTNTDRSETNWSIINSSKKTSSSSSSFDFICFLLAYTYHSYIYSLLVSVFVNSQFSSRLTRWGDFANHWSLFFFLVWSFRSLVCRKFWLSKYSKFLFPRIIFVSSNNLIRSIYRCQYQRWDQPSSSPTSNRSFSLQDISLLYNF